MEKFNSIMNNISNCGLPLGAEEDVTPDTDSNVGEVGDIGGEEESENFIILHLGGGVKIHVPIEVARLIADALADESDANECDRDGSDLN